MGQVIRLDTLAAAYPAHVDALDFAETVFLGAVRRWVAEYRAAEDPIPRLCKALDAVRAHDAAFSVDQLMAVVARTARQSVAIHCPRCPHLSDDEMHLLQAASLVQAGEAILAERALRTALLSAAGAEFALGPLEGLAEVFREARLLFRRRKSRPGHAASDAVWLPPEQANQPTDRV
jgi:hypothetical protein